MTDGCLLVSHVLLTKENKWFYASYMSLCDAFVKLHYEQFTDDSNVEGFRCTGSDSRMRVQAFGCVK